MLFTWPVTATDFGRAARSETPRSSHAHWEPPANRIDPIVILRKQARRRVPELVPIRTAVCRVTVLLPPRGSAHLRKVLGDVLAEFDELAATTRDNKGAPAGTGLGAGAEAATGAASYGRGGAPRRGPAPPAMRFRGARFQFF